MESQDSTPGWSLWEWNQWKHNRGSVVTQVDLNAAPTHRHFDYWEMMDEIVKYPQLYGKQALGMYVDDFPDPIPNPIPKIKRPYGKTRRNQKGYNP